MKVIQQRAAAAKARLSSRQSAGQLPFVGYFVAGSIMDLYTNAVRRQVLDKLLACALGYST